VKPDERSTPVSISPGEPKEALRNPSGPRSAYDKKTSARQAPTMIQNTTDNPKPILNSCHVNQPDVGMEDGAPFGTSYRATNGIGNTLTCRRTGNPRRAHL
jgi:hypothetical protein